MTIRRAITLFITYGLGLLIFGYFVVIGGRRVITEFLTPKLVPLAFFVVVTGLIFIMGSLRWGLIVNRFNPEAKPSWLQYFLYFSIGRFIGQYVSWAGSDLLLRPLLLKGADDISLKRGFRAVIYDKAFDLLFFIAFLSSTVVFILTQDSTITIVIALCALIAVVFVTLNKVIFRRLIRLGSLIFHWIAGHVPWFRSYTGNYEDQLTSEPPPLSHSDLILILALTMTKYSGIFVRIHFLILALDLALPRIAVWAGIPVAHLSLVFAFTPGGLGIFEGGWYGVLAAMGIAPTTISAFVTGQRVYLILATAIVALIAYVGILLDSLPLRRITRGKQ